MSLAVRSFVAALFGSEDSSDCIIEFSLSKDEADRAAKRQRKVSEHVSETRDAEEKPGVDAAPTAAGEPSQPPGTDIIGETLPAHTVVLRPGSTFFRSQAERWTIEQPAGAKRVLRVPLGSADEMPHARSAIRFIYTGELQVSLVADLLRVRRLACFLGVEGCTEACDAALLAAVRKASVQPLTSVAELYACRTLLPDRGEDPAAAALLDGLRAASQEQLVAYKGADKEITATGGSKMQLSELLAWAFQDAPGVLNDPTSKGRVRSLPSSSLEALLSCDAFATDDEASVLLLLAEWLDANPGTADDVRKRLCHYIRLCHLNTGYLHGVLPLLSWFPLTPVERSLLWQVLTVPSGAARDQAVSQATGADYKWPACWTSGPARPYGSGSVGRVYEWSITQAVLAAQLNAKVMPGGTASCSPTFASGASGLVYRGFEFYPSLQLPVGSDTASMYLLNRLPACLKLSNVPAIVAMVNPGTCRLTTWKWVAGSGGKVERQAAHVYASSDWASAMRSGSGWGYAKALPLLAAPAGAAPGWATPTLLARWAPYLHEGKISGTLEWLPA